MKTYSKGSRGERDLLHILNFHGFSVMRAPSSGGFLTAVDVVAIKKGTILAFECKTHDKKPRLNKKQEDAFRKWCENAGAHGFLAWRGSKQDWLFLRIQDVTNKKYDDEHWISKDVFLKIFQ